MYRCVCVCVCVCVKNKNIFVRNNYGQVLSGGRQRQIYLPLLLFTHVVQYHSQRVTPLPPPSLSPYLIPSRITIHNDNTIKGNPLL